MKKLIVLYLLSMICLQIWPGNRTESQMKSAAIVTLNANSTRSASGSELKEYLSLSTLKIYGYDQGGFAVVTTDDRFESVIGYSNTRYNNSAPCGFKWWVEKVNENMAMMKEPVVSRHKTRGETGVAPLLTTIWGQERPFNDNCTFSNGNSTYQCVTGCVATALTQIMNYYKFPECGTGSFSYDVKYNNSFTITFSEDFSQSVYDWKNMLDNYTSYSKTKTKDVHTQAVAKLMKDCAVAIKTNFSDNTHGSSSNLSRAVEALKTYFYYDSSSKLYNRSDYEKNDWMNLIYSTLDNGRPILYSGSESDKVGSNGHAFVLHGYDSSGNVLVNWGWDGRFDGYFDIDLLNPNNDQYSYRQNMVIAIPGNNQPSTQLHTLTLTSKGSGTVYLGNRDGQQVREETLSFKIKEGNNAVLLLSPDIGCKLKTLAVNSGDVTSSVVGNEYSISNIQSAINVEVEFEKTSDIAISDYNTFLTCVNKALYTQTINSYFTRTIEFEIMNSGTEDVYITKLVAKDPSSNKILFSSTDTSILGEFKGGNAKTLKQNIDEEVMPIYEFEYTLGNSKYIYETSKYKILSITSNSYGTVTYSTISVGAETRKFSIESGNATIVLTPKGESVLNKLLVNSTDVTSNVSNNQYTIKNITSNVVVEATFDALNTIDGHEYVDLGLPSGKLWSTMNYGAKSPEECGKYVSGPRYLNWGDHWKTPDKDEMKELITECQWTWTELNGVNGYSIKGPNNNTMFLPAAGENSDIWGASGIGSRLNYFTSTEGDFGPEIWILSGSSSEYKLTSAFVVMEEYPIRPISTVIKEPGAKYYTLSITSNGNGSVTYDNIVIRNDKSEFKIKEGTEASIKFTPDNGYIIKSLSDNNSDVVYKVENDQYVISKIAGDIDIKVEFEAIPPKLYKLTYLVDGEIYKEYEMEEGVIITPEPEPTKEGFTFSGWSWIPSKMPAENVTVTGTFKQIIFTIDNITYEITSEGTVSVKGGDQKGSVEIAGTVVINSQTYNVTAIAENAFKDNKQITSLTIADGIRSIGDNAFNGCLGLFIINIGKDVTTIGHKAFANVGTSSAASTRGDNVLTVNCYAESVPQTAADAFENSPIATGTLLVNDNIVDAYKTTSPWSQFGKIQGFQEAAGIGSIIIDNPNAHIYDMQGNRIDNLQKGVNIIRLEDGKTKKVIVK